MTLSAPEQSALIDVAAAIGSDPGDLSKLIQFESGWNPAAKNKLSSARGLIQFIDSTARSLGYTDSLDLVSRNPTRESQLRGPVFQYLKKYAPLDTRQALAMSVFYPSFMRVPPLTEFPSGVQRVNPGIRTVRDYLYKVYSDSGPLLALAVVYLGVLFALTRKGSQTWQRRQRRA